MQRGDSRLLSHTGLRYYRDYDFKQYEQLEMRFLTGTWIKENDGIRIREIAHNIRNKYNNNKHKLNHLQLSLLFDWLPEIEIGIYFN